MNQSTEVLQRLMETIERRVAELPDGSYTTRLIRGGVPKIGEKITEEAAEVIEAAIEDHDSDRKHLTHELADLFYHTFVMMAHKGVSLNDVAQELARREGVSGLEEKRKRGGEQ